MTPEQAALYRAVGAAHADASPPLTEAQAETIARILAVGTSHALELEHASRQDDAGRDRPRRRNTPAP